MAAKNRNIRLNAMEEGSMRGIAIDTIILSQTAFTAARQYDEALQAHRDEGHTFHILVKGTVVIEIDFKKYTIKAPSITYMHPNQVHRIVTFNKVTVTSLAISNENLAPSSLALLEEISPAPPLSLTKQAFALIKEAASLCMKIAKEQKEPLQHAQLGHSSNALVALIIPRLLAHTVPAAKFSRAETISKSFKTLLDKKYKMMKSPAAFAGQLNISAAYLNECVKNTTGYPVSHHIQQRIVLEAKRLLYHSDKSVKEIASELGYDDPAYFFRLFTKLNGSAAVSFRNKNHE